MTLRTHLTRPAIAALLAVAATLTACGGGSDPVYADPVNAAAAWQSLYATPRNWNLTGTGSDGLTYTLALSLAPGGSQTFPLTGNTGNTSRQNTTLTASNGTVLNGTQVYFLDPFNTALQGVQYPLTNLCTQATNSVLPPASTPVGTSGVQAQLNSYEGCNLATPVGAVGSLTWGVDYDRTAGVYYFCATANSTDAAGTKYSERDCFETTAQGQIGARASVYMQSTTAAGVIWTLGLRSS